MSKRVTAVVLCSLLLTTGSALAYAPRPAVLSLSVVSRTPPAADCSPLPVHRPTVQPPDCPTFIHQPAPTENPQMCGIYCGNNPVNNFDPLGLTMEGAIFEPWKPTIAGQLLGWMSRVQMRAQNQRKEVLESSRSGEIGGWETTAKYLLLKPADMVSGLGSLPLSYKLWWHQQLAQGRYWNLADPQAFLRSGFNGFVEHTGTAIGNLSADPNGANVAVMADVAVDWLLIEEGVRGAARLARSEVPPTLPEGINGPRIGPAIETADSTDKVVYIGKLRDLEGLPANQTLLPELPNLGIPKANYYQNISVLRRKLWKGYEVRDASRFRQLSDPDPLPGWLDRTIRQSGLGAERNLLNNRNLKLNPSTGSYE